MSSSTVKPIPDGMHTLTPHLVCDGVGDAIEFYKKALGAVEMSRLQGGNGKFLHAAMRVGDSTFFLADEMPEHGTLGPKALKGTPIYVHMYVEDAGAALDRAAAAGGEVVLPIWDAPWGDKYGQFRDPFGHFWSVATHVRDVTPEELQKAMKATAG
jgi:PhnB protein